MQSQGRILVKQDKRFFPEIYEITSAPDKINNPCSYRGGCFRTLLNGVCRLGKKHVLIEYISAW